MVNIFGDRTAGGGGGRGKRGPAGPQGKRGKPGESSNYYGQYFRHSKTKWEIDVEPVYWIDGFDIEESPLFKVLNKHDHQYDVTLPSSLSKPTKGTDPVTGRHTLKFNGTQYLTCPMNWNTIAENENDNLQIFVVFKYTDNSQSSSCYDGLFGNDNGGFDRFVSRSANGIMISGGKNSGETKSSPITINSFPSDADPRKNDRFCVLSVHWNNKGSSGCGEDKSNLYCNGKKVGTFTSADISGTTLFTLGAISNDGVAKVKAEIGRFLVCGNRDVPMDDEEIKNVHRYLMNEWQINKKQVQEVPLGHVELKGKKVMLGVVVLTICVVGCRNWYWNSIKKMKRVVLRLQILRKIYKWELVVHIQLGLVVQMLK